MVKEDEDVLILTEMRVKIDSYISGRKTLIDFEDWFHELSYDADRRLFGDVAGMVYSVESFLAESSSGLWDEDALKGELNAIVAEFDRGMISLD